MKKTNSKSIVFKISGSLGHFRNHESNNTKQTFGLPPRTAIAGLIGAICGLERDSYYEDFNVENADISIIPSSEINTIMIPLNVPSTASENTGEGFETFKQLDFNGRKSTKIIPPKNYNSRQREPYTYLSNPEYIITVALENKELYKTLHKHLKNGTVEFPPNLGLTELIATIEYIGEFEVKKTDSTNVDSYVPVSEGDVKLSSDVEVKTERQIRNFEKTESGRKPQAYETYYYNPNANTLPVTKETNTYKIGPYTCCIR